MKEYNGLYIIIKMTRVFIYFNQTPIEIYTLHIVSPSTLSDPVRLVVKEKDFFFNIVSPFLDGSETII